MRNFSGAVSWDGQTISGVSTITALRATTDVITLHDGGTGATFHAPGRSDTDSVTVTRGVSEDLTFDLWARGPALRKVVELALVDTSDGLTVTYRLPDCWVAAYTVAPDLETGIVVESLTLSTGPWQRVTPPVAKLAEQLAGERSVSVRRIDVAALLSTFQRETAANLDAVFAEAEQTGAVLLLDEADALFSKRSDVQDSHDRYANAEVDALLQRLSAYRGQVVIAPPERRSDANGDGGGGDPTRPPT